MKKIQTADRRTHYVEMDALRGIAILGVLASHTAAAWKNDASAFEGPPPQLPLTVPFLGVDAMYLFLYGGLGVFLFFLLSGYLLAWSEDERMRRGTYNVRSYALRRALRILPAYYVAIPIIVALSPTNPSVKDVLLNLSFLWVILYPFQTNPVDGAFWSLTSEVVFYLLLPFVVVKMQRPWQRLTLLGLLVVLSSAVGYYIAQSGFSGQELESGTINLVYLSQLPGHLFFFMVGMLLRMMVERLGDEKAKSRWRPLVASVLFLTSVSFFVTHPYLETPNIGEIIMVIAFFASAVLGAPFLRGVLRWKPLAFVGVISYSMFLLNDMIVIIATDIMQHARSWAASEGTSLAVWAGFSAYALGVLIAVFIVSGLSYRYVESPFLRRKPT